MPSDEFDLVVRVKLVEREFAALRFTTEYASRAILEGGIELEAGLQRLDITRATERLEGTYIIRLFSEFEVVLKTFLRERKIQKLPRDAKPLIDRVASYIKFAGSILDNAHAVRLYRNKLVHDFAHGMLDDQGMTIRSATSHLCTFLSRSVARW